MFPAVAFSRKAAIVNPSAQPGPPGAPTGTMELTKAERSAEPKTKEELREAAKRARAEAARYEILADAQKGTASEPEETGRGRTRRRERRGTISSSGEKRQWTDISKEDKKRRLGESTDNMKQYIRRRHKERKEATARASRAILISEQMEREDTWNPQGKKTRHRKKR